MSFLSFVQSTFDWGGGEIASPEDGEKGAETGEQLPSTKICLKALISRQTQKTGSLAAWI